MKKIDVRKHTKKFMENAKNGDYPNKKVAKIGSIVGLCISVILLCVGVYGITHKLTFGIGCLVIGIICGISNGLNMRRIKKNSRF